jgi:hypothetical protein
MEKPVEHDRIEENNQAEREEVTSHKERYLKITSHKVSYLKVAHHKESYLKVTSHK